MTKIISALILEINKLKKLLLKKIMKFNFFLKHVIFLWKLSYFFELIYHHALSKTFFVYADARILYSVELTFQETAADKNKQIFLQF